MTTQLRNDDMVELLAADFFRRNEPNASWSHTVSDHLLLPALRGFWPMSAHHVTTQSIYVDDIACGYDLGMLNTPELQLARLGLPPCCGFTAANSEYLSYGADDMQHKILGLETNIPANQRGLSLGCWAKFNNLGSNEALISKWLTAGNLRSYLLMKTAADQIVFFITFNGAAAFSVTSTATILSDIWYHIVGRFIPGALDVYVDGVCTTNAVGIPASLFNTTCPLEMGRVDAASYLDGYLSLAWLSSSRCWDNGAATRDVIPWALYEHSKKMFNKG